MARPRAKIELTLFPFLSVLCGLIAVLMLFMVLILNTRRIGAATTPPSRATAAVGAREVPDRHPRDLGIDEAEYGRLKAKIQELNDLINQRYDAFARAQQMVRDLESLVEVKKAMKLVPVDGGGRRKGVILGTPNIAKMIRARGYSVPKLPVWVEVSAKGYVVHRGETEIPYRLEEYPPFRQAKAPKGGTTSTPDPGFRRFLEGVDRDRKREYIVFLIRPDGVPAFREALSYFETNFKAKHQDNDFGLEPFSEEWLRPVTESGTPSD